MMTLEQAHDYMNDVECSRYSAECPEHAEIVYRNGRYYLEHFNGYFTDVVDEVDMGSGETAPPNERR